MQNFEFYNPTNIVFGSKTIARLAELVPDDVRVLVLYGGASAQKNGTLDEVRAALGARDVQEFGGIEPNPTYETMMRAVEQVRNGKIDFLLAVGGGSVIDGTKFVAAAVNFPGDAWDILLTHGQNIESALPFGVVLTLPATGSEMNCGSVIMRRASHAKLAFMNRYVFPQFSILDPSKTYTLPPQQIANGVVDTYVHIIEQYLTYPVGGMVQDRFAEGLLQTLIELGPKALATPEDHARTLAIVLPSLLNVQREGKRTKLLQYAERVWQVTDGDEAQRIDEAIRRTAQFFESIGIKTHLADYGLGSDVIDALIAQLEAHGMTALGEHKNINLDVSRKILEGAL